jgi:hypothetical protein
MSEKQTYKVLVQLDGDKPYFKGDTREMTEAEAQHLVDLGVLEKVEPATETRPKQKK